MRIFEDRRALHRIPELDRSLEETFAYLRGALEGLRCEIIEPMQGALCALFDFGAERTVAFRADADALPIEEQTFLPYTSCHPGRMHACGHDGHMAILLELARRVNACQTLDKNILLAFQGAEETTGGARDLCATGIFKKHGVEAIFGIHLWPGLKKGEVFSRCNEMMSRSCEVRVDIVGRSAHLAKADEGIDAMAAGVEFYNRAVAMEQALPKTVFRLLKFGKMESGTVCNAISGHTRLEGSLRAFQDDVFYSMRAGLVSIGKKVERSFGCTVSIYMNEGYPPVMNPRKLYDRVKNTVEFSELAVPSMITEDFSWYQKSLPGMFFFLGTGKGPALHSDRFTFDEQVLVKGADFFMELAERF